MLRGKVLLFKMLSVAAFCLTLFPFKRVAGFSSVRNNGNRLQCAAAIASRHQQGSRNSAFKNTRFSYVNNNLQSKILGHRARIRTTVYTTARKLSADPEDVLVATEENLDDDDVDDDDVDGEIDDEVHDEISPSQLSTPEEFLPGIINGFSIVKIYETDEDSEFDMDKIRTLLDSDDVSRLELTSRNISVPVALMMLNPEEYPSRSQARKACRKSNIVIHRGPLDEIFDTEKWERARVGCRIIPGDVLARQLRIGDGTFPDSRHEKPPFDLPVIFEDSHFAIGKIQRSRANQVSIAALSYRCSLILAVSFCLSFCPIKNEF